MELKERLWETPIECDVFVKENITEHFRITGNFFVDKKIRVNGVVNAKTVILENEAYTWSIVAKNVFLKSETSVFFIKAEGDVIVGDYSEVDTIISNGVVIIGEHVKVKRIIAQEGVVIGKRSFASDICSGQEVKLERKAESGNITAKSIVLERESRCNGNIISLEDVILKDYSSAFDVKAHGLVQTGQEVFTGNIRAHEVQVGYQSVGAHIWATEKIQLDDKVQTRSLNANEVTINNGCLVDDVFAQGNIWVGNRSHLGNVISGADVSMGIKCSADNINADKGKLEICEGGDVKDIKAIDIFLADDSFADNISAQGKVLLGDNVHVQKIEAGGSILLGKNSDALEILSKAKKIYHKK